MCVVALPGFPKFTTQTRFVSRIGCARWVDKQLRACKPVIFILFTP